MAFACCACVRWYRRAQDLFLMILFLAIKCKHNLAALDGNLNRAELPNSLLEYVQGFGMAYGK